MLSKLPALSSLNPNMTFWEWCANMTWTKYFFFIKSIFHVHSRTWVIMWGFHILLFFDGESFLLYLRCGFQREVEKAYSTWYSQAVSHPSTNQAGPCLASEIRRDRAYSGWYGRKHASTHDTLFIHVNISGEVFNKTKWRSLQHLVFPGSLPSKY